MVKMQDSGATGNYTHCNTYTSATKEAPSEAQMRFEKVSTHTDTAEHLTEPDVLHEAPAAASGEPGISAAAPTSTDTIAAEANTSNAPPKAAPVAPQNPIQAIVQYNAEDTIVFDAKRQTVHLYGTGNIEYDTIKLEAEEVLIDWTQHTIAASSKKNEAGDVIKKTVLTKEGVEYVAESVLYNFVSQRAIANKLFTKQDDSILRASKVKKDRETTFYTDRATYTTCNLAVPHFHVAAQRLKIHQNDKVVSGPFQLYFDGVPTLLGFPFGIFYFPRGGSGIIPPKYGGESTKGFCLKDGGYYIKWKDYADLALQGSIYSKGSNKLKATGNYKKRYGYEGHFHFARAIYLTPDESKLTQKIKGWHFLWRHNTEKDKASSWHAHVDLANKGSYRIDDLLSDENNTTSKDASIRYTNALVGFPLPYTADGSLRLHASQIGKYEARLPELSLGTANIYPFKRRSATKTRWYSNIYLRHKAEFQNKLSNSFDDTLDFLKPKDWSELWNNSKKGARNTITLQTNIKILSHLNLAPQITGQALWYWEKKEYRHDAGRIKATKVPGFTQALGYHLGGTLKTTCYGTRFIGHNATIQAIRHQFSPALTFTYTPSLSNFKYGHWQTINGGQQRGKKLNRFEGAVYPAPQANDTAVLAINLSNRLDIKVKGRSNAKSPTKKVPILESFDWHTDYDFLAEQHGWGDIQFKTRTNLFDKLINIRFESTFDPYLYNKSNDQRYERSHALAWNHGQGLGRVKKALLSVGTRLSSGKKRETFKQQEAPSMRIDATPTQQEGAKQYVAFMVPWQLTLAYNWYYECLTPGGDLKKINSLNLDWHINLTQKWEITCKSAYDLKQKKFVDNATTIGIHRDLHCWEMDFAWSPLGEKQIYRFSVGLKAPLLKDLKYSRGERRYTKY
ncbi:MAG: putative LPS assembly protein LptD [Bacteroidota bacterium]